MTTAYRLAGPSTKPAAGQTQARAGQPTFVITISTEITPWRLPYWPQLE